MCDRDWPEHEFYFAMNRSVHGFRSSFRCEILDSQQYMYMRGCRYRKPSIPGSSTSEIFTTPVTEISVANTISHGVVSNENTEGSIKKTYFCVPQNISIIQGEEKQRRVVTFSLAQCCCLHGLQWPVNNWTTNTRPSSRWSWRGFLDPLPIGCNFSTWKVHFIWIVHSWIDVVSTMGLLGLIKADYRDFVRITGV